jgi:choice-of-anchor B domain-containing protein
MTSCNANGGAAAQRNRFAKKPPFRRTGGFGCRPPRLEPLEDRLVLDGLSLLGNWHENAGHMYADGWGEGHYAYIGHYLNQSGVDIIDIADPTNPVQVANFRGIGGDNEIRDIEVQNHIGFFSSDTSPNGGVYIVDLSNPAAPVQIARITPANGGASHVHTVCVDGAFLYEADSSTPNIRVFNISDPANPSFVRTIVSNSGGPVHEVTARNGRLYTAVISSTGRSEIYDITNVGDPNQPVPLLGSIASGSYTHTAWPTDDGNYVAVARETFGGDVKIWDIHDPAHPVLASTISLPTSETYSLHQVMIRHNLLYISAYEAGALVYNITDPTTPVRVGSYATYQGPVNGYAGCWGFFPFLGQARLLAFDIQNGLFILSAQALSEPVPASPALTGVRIDPPARRLFSAGSADNSSGIPATVDQAQMQIQTDRLQVATNSGIDGQDSGEVAVDGATASAHRTAAVLDADLGELHDEGVVLDASPVF